MSKTIAVANPDANLPDLTVIAGDATTAGEAQYVRLDLGSGAANAVAVATVPVSGTVMATVANATISGNVTVVQPTGTNLHVVVDTAPTTAVTIAAAVDVSDRAARLVGVVSTKTDLTPSAPTATTVGVASAQALASNANRKGLYLTNTSVNTISLGFGSAAVLNSGITLFPKQTFWMAETDFDLGAVNAIASAASSNLAIQEYTT